MPEETHFGVKTIGSVGNATMQPASPMPPEDDGRWARELLALHFGEIDWPYLTRRSEEEKTYDALLAIKEGLNNT